MLASSRDESFLLVVGVVSWPKGLVSDRGTRGASIPAGVVVLELAAWSTSGARLPFLIRPPEPAPLESSGRGLLFHALNVPLNQSTARCNEHVLNAGSNGLELDMPPPAAQDGVYSAQGTTVDGPAAQVDPHGQVLRRPTRRRTGRTGRS